jgi:type I restriction enzyme, S subunit
MSSELKALWQGAGVKLPDDWSIIPLESLLRDSKSIAVGVMYPGDHTPGGTPLIKVGDIRDGTIPFRPSYCISSETNQEYRRTQLAGDELLITLVGNPGECVVVKPEMAGWNAARAIASIKLRDAGLRTYVKAVLESSAGKHLIDAVLNTTVQKTLNLKDIRRLPIPMPSRRAIAEVSFITETLSDRVTLLRESNATLEAIAEALFKSWFVDFDPVRAKMEGRTPDGMEEPMAALFPAELQESELGPIPRGWSIGILEDLLMLQRGFDLPKLGRTAGNFPVIAASGTHGTHVDAMVKGPGVITGRSGVLGRVFLELDDFWPLNTTLWVKEFRRATPCYAYELLRRLDFQSFNAGSAVPTLNRNHVHGLPCVLPSERCVQAYERIALVLHQRARAQSRQAETLVEIRDTLLPRLISGKLRLSDVEAALTASGSGPA